MNHVITEYDANVQAGCLFMIGAMIGVLFGIIVGMCIYQNLLVK